MIADASGQQLREALARFASGVTIVTTVDACGRWWGFTASAFCSVSQDPPLVLVCLSRSADCHAAFTRGNRFVVNVLSVDHEPLARRFAAKGEDKFVDAPFAPDADGLPVLSDAVSRVHCRSHAVVDGGDHDILIGRVGGVTLGDAPPMVFYDRRFHRLPPVAVSDTPE